MRRTYDTCRGYMTLKEADEYIMNQLSKSQPDKEPSHYKHLLAAAKVGRFGGKPYKKRMYQVKRDEIMKYVDYCLQANQLHINEEHHNQQLEEATTSCIQFYDQKTSNHLLSALCTLYQHSIISKELYLQEVKHIKNKTIIK